MEGGEEGGMDSVDLPRQYHFGAQPVRCQGERLSRGCFTRQPVNVACLEAFTKVRPVSHPSASRQRPVRRLSSCARKGEKHSAKNMPARKRFSITTPIFQHPDWRFDAPNAKFNHRALSVFAGGSGARAASRQCQCADSVKQ
jgi:hypothetical protein